MVDDTEAHRRTHPMQPEYDPAFGVDDQEGSDGHEDHDRLRNDVMGIDVVSLCSMAEVWRDAV